MKPIRALRSLLIPLACLLALAAGLRAADNPATADSKPALPRLVDLGADKCIPCKMMAPILGELEKDYAGQLEVVFLDVWKKREEGSRYNIRVIPTQIFFDAGGKELFRHEGFYAKKDILAKWAELGVALRAPAAPGQP
ncbi:MAG: thioredoxin family protein [Lacunisphaera sp.]|nr:thioredoxin family protein [Lacunisphaera sp.]